MLFRSNDEMGVTDDLSSIVREGVAVKGKLLLLLRQLVLLTIVTSRHNLSRHVFHLGVRIVVIKST